jgi:TonB-linked SusC/RagA family outer membrane protein
MRKNLFLIVLLSLSSLGLFAQSKVTGKVTADDGSALPGVSVLIKGTTQGVQSNADGDYAIDAPANSTLVFSFVGMITQELNTGNKTKVNVQLKDDAQVLSEVVVTAQGIVREKRALGYAVSSVDEKAISNRPQADVGRVLQGKIAGVNITSTSGVSGTGTNINIRGFSSITGSVQPLFVVDGIPFNSATNTRGGFTSGGQTASSRFLDIDPNTIENVTVLKGLAATVTYGDQGRNGVILVTTKNGSQKARKSEISVTQSVFTNNANLPRYQNTYVGGFQGNLGYFFSNWGPSLEEARNYPSQNTNRGLTTHPYAFFSNTTTRAAFADYVTSQTPYEMQVYPNNVNDFFRQGLISNSAINISGGTDKVSYNVSGGYTDEQGYIPNNGLKRLNLGLGINGQLTKKLSIVNSLLFANTTQFSPPLSSGQGNNANDFPSVLANVMYTPRQVDLMGWPYQNPTTGGTIYFRSGNDIPNPRWILENYKTTGVVNRITNSTAFNYDFTDRLKMTYRVGLDTYNEQQEYLLNKGGTVLVNGFYSTVSTQNTIWDHNLNILYSHPFSDEFTLSGRIGANMRNDRNRVDVVTSQNQLAGNLFRHGNFIDNVASNSTEEQTRMGIFGDITADFKNYLFVNFQGRNDWTSTVEPQNRRIFYPSTSLSFIPTQAFEGLQSSVVNYLKLRAGYGTSAGFPNPYRTRNILNQAARGWLTPAGGVATTQSVDNFLGNPNLRPEQHEEYELGIEGKFLKNRINLDFTVFRRNTKNLITNAPLDASTGFTSTTINLGKIRNEGIEISLGGDVLTKGQFSWNANLIYSRIVPTVLDLGGSLQEVQITGFGSALGNYAIVGRPFNMIKGIGYRRNDQGQLLIDGGGNLITTPTPIELGNPNPAFTSSLINEFSYKGFSLNVMLSYRHGGAMYSTTAGALLGRGLTTDTGIENNGYDRAQTFIFSGVKADGQPNTTQITASDANFNNVYFFGDEGRIFNATTIRLQEVALSYALPKSMLAKSPFKGVSFVLSGNNLWYYAPYFPKGLNFDTDNLGLGVGNGLGFEFLTGPSSRRFGGTLKLTF